MLPSPTTASFSDPTGTTLIAAYWTGRDDGRDRIAQQLYMTVSGLRALGPELSSWVVVDEETAQDVPVASVDVCRRALDQGAGSWGSGEAPRVAYEARLFVESSSATLSMTAGIESLATLGVYAPNRLRLRLPVVDRTVIERALRVVVTAMRPDWAAASAPDDLTLPEPVFGRGQPVVGWLTYLASHYPAPPLHLPENALALPVGSQGTLFVAHASLYHRSTPDQREAIAALRHLLRAEGVLISAYDLAARGGGAA